MAILAATWGFYPWAHAQENVPQCSEMRTANVNAAQCKSMFPAGTGAALLRRAVLGPDDVAAQEAVEFIRNTATSLLRSGQSYAAAKLINGAFPPEAVSSAMHHGVSLASISEILETALVTESGASIGDYLDHIGTGEFGPTLRLPEKERTAQVYEALALALLAGGADQQEAASRLIARLDVVFKGISPWWLSYAAHAARICAGHREPMPVLATDGYSPFLSEAMLQYRVAHDSDEAIRVAKLAVKRARAEPWPFPDVPNPELIDSLMLQFYVALDHGDRAKALALLKQAIPKPHRDQLIAIAHIFMERKDVDEAERWLKRARRDFPWPDVPEEGNNWRMAQLEVDLYRGREIEALELARNVVDSLTIYWFPRETALGLNDANMLSRSLLQDPRKPIDAASSTKHNVEILLQALLKSPLRPGDDEAIYRLLATTDSLPEQNFALLARARTHASTDADRRYLDNAKAEAKWKSDQILSVALKTRELAPQEIPYEPQWFAVCDNAQRIAFNALREKYLPLLGGKIAPNSFRSDYGLSISNNVRRALAPSLSDLIASLDPDEVQLLVSTFQTFTVLGVIDKTGAHYFAVPISANQLADAGLALHESILTKRYQEGDPHAALLAKALLEPVKPLLKNAKTLRIWSNDAAILTVPFAVLPLSWQFASSQLLIDQFDIVVAPPVPVSRLIRPSGFRPRVVAFVSPELSSDYHCSPTIPGGLPVIGGLADVDVLRRMCSIGQLSTNVRSALPPDSLANAMIVDNKNATETKVKELDRAGQLRQANLVVFATHGLTAKESGTAFWRTAGLVLTPPAVASETDDGYLSTQEIEELNINADMVMLVACESAGGLASKDPRPFAGLVRSFALSGAHRILASRWEVPVGEAGSILKSVIRDFINNSVSSAHSVNDAIRTLRRADPLPYYWAAFTLMEL